MTVGASFASPPSSRASQETDLSGADLSDANLEGADLSRAKLNGANVTGANLVDVDVYDAQFNGGEGEGERARLGHDAEPG